MKKRQKLRVNVGTDLPADFQMKEMRLQYLTKVAIIAIAFAAFFVSAAVGFIKSDFSIFEKVWTAESSILNVIMAAYFYRSGKR